MAGSRHRCYRCVPVEDDSALSPDELESLQTTCSEQGDEVFFASGYSAHEIALRRARETQGHVFANNVSRKIKRPDLSVPVEYAVARSPVYTVRGPDEHHRSTYRAYWRPLE